MPKKARRTAPASSTPKGTYQLTKFGEGRADCNFKSWSSDPKARVLSEPEMTAAWATLKAHLARGKELSVADDFAQVLGWTPIDDVHRATAESVAKTLSRSAYLQWVSNETKPDEMDMTVAGICGYVDDAIARARKTGGDYSAAVKHLDAIDSYVLFECMADVQAGLRMCLAYFFTGYTFARFERENYERELVALEKLSLDNLLAVRQHVLQVAVAATAHNTECRAKVDRLARQAD
mgnify:FL=1